MTTREILEKDKDTLCRVENAINALTHDKRPKSVELLNRFIELKENLQMSIESNETALKIGIE